MPMLSKSNTFASGCSHHACLPEFGTMPAINNKYFLDGRTALGQSLQHAYVHYI
jgi:hypothetical protein